MYNRYMYVWYNLLVQVRWPLHYYTMCHHHVRVCVSSLSTASEPHWSLFHPLTVPLSHGDKKSCLLERKKHKERPRLPSGAAIPWWKGKLVGSMTDTLVTRRPRNGYIHDKILNQSIEHNYVLLHIMYCLWGGFRGRGREWLLGSVKLCGTVWLH